MQKELTLLSVLRGHVEHRALVIGTTVADDAISEVKVATAATNKVGDGILGRGLDGQVWFGEDTKCTLALWINLRCEANDRLCGDISITRNHCQDAGRIWLSRPIGVVERRCLTWCASP